MHVTKPYEFIGFGDIHGPKPFEFKRFVGVAYCSRGRGSVGVARTTVPSCSRLPTASAKCWACGLELSKGTSLGRGAAWRAASAGSREYHPKNPFSLICPSTVGQTSSIFVPKRALPSWEPVPECVALSALPLGTGSHYGKTRFDPQASTIFGPTVLVQNRERVLVRHGLGLYKGMGSPALGSYWLIIFDSDWFVLVRPWFRLFFGGCAPQKPI